MNASKPDAFMSAHAAACHTDDLAGVIADFQGINSDHIGTAAQSYSPRFGVLDNVDNVLGSHRSRVLVKKYRA
jgi:hypothetical protein